MAASEAAVSAVMKALDKHVLDWNVNTTWHCSCGVRLRNRGEAMTHRAVAAADAAVDADRASIQAETLRMFALRHRTLRLSTQHPIWPAQLDDEADRIEGKP